ncbi:DNA primase [bioreactor metagenome]|uniref:DNA primase n=1 Tax=bioreactor metagenome TaxID=1076179 RepID=A0A644YI85_9ZZZZ
MQADVRVTTLPEGKDPDEVVLQDPEEWQRILDNAKPIVVHVMETLASHANLDDAKVKADIVAQVQPLIEDVPSAVERDAYRQQLARLLKLDERTLLGSQRVYNSAPRRRRTRVDGLSSEKPAAKAEVKTENRTYNLEGHCLELLLRKTDDLYALDRALQMNGLDRFSPADFENAEHQLIVKVLMEGLTQDAQEPLEYIRQHIPADLQERYIVLVKPGTLEQEKNDEKILEDLIRTIMNLRLLRVKETLNQLRFMQQEEPETEEEKQTWQKMTLQYTLLRGKLDQAIGRPQLTS